MCSPRRENDTPGHLSVRPATSFRSFSGLNHCPKSRSKSTSTVPLKESSKVVSRDIEPMKSLLLNSPTMGSTVEGIEWLGWFIFIGGPPRMADGDGAVILGVGGAVPPWPEPLGFGGPWAVFGGAFRGEPSGRLLRCPGTPLLSLGGPPWSFGGPFAAGEGGGIMPPGPLFGFILGFGPALNWGPGPPSAAGEPALPGIPLGITPGGILLWCTFCIDCR